MRRFPPEPKTRDDHIWELENQLFDLFPLSIFKDKIILPSNEKKIIIDHKVLFPKDK